MNIVLYDGDCGVCAKVAEQLSRRLDPQRTRFHAWQSMELAALPAEVTAERLDTAMALVRPDGSVAWGYDAFAALFQDTRATRGWGRLLALRPLAWLGRWAYRRFARHRRGLSILLGLRACKLPPRPRVEQ